MHAIVHAADVQDRDGGALLMASLFGGFPFLIKLYADGGYQGPEFQSAVKRILARVNVEIVKRSDQATDDRLAWDLTSAWSGGYPSSSQSRVKPSDGGSDIRSEPLRVDQAIGRKDG